MAILDKPNILCSLSSRSMVDKYLSSKSFCSLSSFSEAWLQLELDVLGDIDGELEIVLNFGKMFNTIVYTDQFSSQSFS